MNSKIFLWLNFCLLIFWAKGQSSLFLQAKEALQNQEFNEARISFEKVKNQSGYESIYAHFYMALCMYKQGDIVQARIEWKQFLWENPDFEQINDVRYWLARTCFELGDTKDALVYLSDSKEAKSHSMALFYLNKQNDSELIALYSEIKFNPSLNELLVNRLSLKNKNETERAILSELSKESHSLESMKKFTKEKYNVSLVLPFMFDTWENAESTASRNVWIYEYYQGIKLALEEVNANASWLDIHVYDSKRSAVQIKKIIADIQNSDAIVGPLFPETIDQFVKEESLKNTFTINPFSSNDELAQTTGEYWLMKPTYSTQATKLSDHVSKQIHSNTYFMCFYSDDKRDSTMAYEYMAKMMAKGYTLMEHGRLDEIQAKALQDKLTATHEVIYPKDSADSIAVLPRRFIKERLVRVEELSDKHLPSYVKEDELVRPGLPQRKYISYEMVLDISKDSIGHMAVFTKSEAVINNLLSALAAREDSTRLYGLGDWLSLKSANFALMEQLKVQLIDPLYIEEQNAAIEVLDQLIVEKYNQLPSAFHYAGYETIKFLSYVFKNSSTHNLKQLGFIPGILYEGFLYENNKGNSLVPIVQVIDLQKVRADNSN